METKQVKSLYIKLNDSSTLKIEHNKFRQAVHEAQNKFHNLLKKYKIKALANDHQSNS